MFAQAINITEDDCSEHGAIKPGLTSPMTCSWSGVRLKPVFSLKSG